MFDIEVYTNDGSGSPSVLRKITAIDKTIEIKRKESVKIYPSPGNSKVAFITSGGGIQSGGFGCVLNPDGSLTVNNGSEYPLFISVVRY
ncbi:hypothetical protein J7624_09520 [Wohlfahrtiimonas chitiniclastica]|uniref:hypothetical protein n=1 Tax=Wohlfahrtiimonas chitiniclastica TaxID=400946 RepID=UPI001BCE02E1|nr:hypothetical protein [Wohlfahrtiimonas chitiniclastica]MBS7827380.1 hypothetical protein [Wohlfahrtiimonas chitiniclastica]